MMSDSWSEVLKKWFIQDGPLLIIINGALGPRNLNGRKSLGNWGVISPRNTVGIVGHYLP